MNYTALIVAAGSGSRLGLGYNKLLYTLSNQHTIIEETLSLFCADERCTQFIVVINETDRKSMQALLPQSKIEFVIGGATRQESVYHGLQKVREEVVLIHDGARPWLSMQSLNDLLQEMEHCEACLLCVPVKDTIKRVKNGVIVETYPREELMQAQTPQAFRYRLLLQCYKQAMEAGISATDDAQIVELCAKIDIHVVYGSYENIKITTKEDINGK